MIWRCAGDFFKAFLKFKMAVTDQLYIFLWTEKLSIKFKLFKFHNNIPHDMKMCRCSFNKVFKVLLKFKIAATDQFHIFLWAQKLKGNVSPHIIPVPQRPIDLHVL